METALREYVDRAIAADTANQASPNQQFIARLVRGLTPNQHQAVCHDSSPLLVLAGAGTGKTRVLTIRIALLITAGRTEANQILALTFTNKAAKEMSGRIDQLLGVSSGVLACTFHAFAARILREHGGALYWTTDWTILDQDDSRKLLKKCWNEEFHSVPDKETVERLDLANQATKRSIDYLETLYTLPSDIRTVLNRYENAKRQANVRDFGDIISDLMLLLESDNAALTAIRERFTHILVDEYQDTDGQQSKLLHLLTYNNPNLTVVGDDDQVLYTWRQARIENILGFQNDFNAEVIRLEDNFRSTGRILKAANQLIAANETRLGKTLVTSAEGGEPVRHAHFHDHMAEARWIVARVAEHIEQGHDPQEIAILARASHALNVLESVLNEHGIRYTLSGGKKFQDRQEIKDLSAYLRLIANAHDRPAFARAIAAPKRGVGPALIEQIEETAKVLKTDVNDAARRLALGNMVPINVKEPVLKFAEDIRIVATEMIHGADGRYAVETLLDRTGYKAAIEDELHDAEKMRDQERVETTRKRLQNLSDLARIGEGKTLAQMLDHLGLSEDARRDKNEGIWLGTIHAAKGLEFETVYLPAWEEGVIPSRQSVSGEADVEEERRAGYVAMTRARKRLTITWAESRFNERTEPSRFLADLGIIKPPQEVHTHTLEAA